MRELSNSDYKLYKSVIKATQESLRQTLGSYLEKKYKKVFVTKDYIYAKGEIPIALTAHMDTVFPKPPNSIYYDREQGVIWSPEGGCGDDRAGVFIILKILQSGLKPTIILTTDEELGGAGSEILIKDLPKAPNPLNYIIQLDRHGSNDCVFYDCDNQEFTEYIESFGFCEATGTFSDISIICPKWEVAGVNLSVGYENEHSVSEIVRVSVLMQNIKKIKKMLTAEEIPVFKFIPSPLYYKYNVAFGNYDEVDDWNSSFNLIKCDSCGMLKETFEIIPVEGKNVCGDCCIDAVNWCGACGQPYFARKQDYFLCSECELDLLDNRQKKKKKGGRK